MCIDFLFGSFWCSTICVIVQTIQDGGIFVVITDVTKVSGSAKALKVGASGYEEVAIKSICKYKM